MRPTSAVKWFWNIARELGFQCTNHICLVVFFFESPIKPAILALSDQKYMDMALLCHRARPIGITYWTTPWLSDSGQSPKENPQRHFEWSSCSRLEVRQELQKLLSRQVRKASSWTNTLTKDQTRLNLWRHPLMEESWGALKHHIQAAPESNKEVEPDTNEQTVKQATAKPTK